MMNGENSSNQSCSAFFGLLISSFSPCFNLLSSLWIVLYVLDILQLTNGHQAVPSWNKNLHVLVNPFNFCSEDEDPEYKPLRMPFKDDMDDFTNSPLDDKDETVEGEAEGKLRFSQIKRCFKRKKPINWIWTHFLREEALKVFEKICLCLKAPSKTALYNPAKSHQASKPIEKYKNDRCKCQVIQHCQC